MPTYRTLLVAVDRGVLVVRIPKPEEHKPRRVEIKAGAVRENGSAPAVEGPTAPRAVRGEGLA